MANIKKYAVISICSLIFGGSIIYSSIKHDSKGVENRIKIEETVNQAVVNGEAYYENKFFLNKFKIKGQEFNISNSFIVRAKEFDTDKLVIYIKDRHDRPEIQEEIYYTLEELVKENNLKLLGFEGSEEEKKITRDDMLNTVEKKLSQEKSLYTREQMKKFIKRCKMLAELHDTNSEEKIQKKLVGILSHYLLGGYIFEIAYNNEVDSYGIEDKEIFEEARRINKETCFEGNIGSLPKFEDKVIEERTNKSIDILLEKMDETNTKTAIIVYGGGHTRSIVEKLEKERISYLILEPFDYQPKSDQLDIGIRIMNIFKSPKG